jgi:uncharacterized protein YgbK (DUF1537 family)
VTRHPIVALSDDLTGAVAAAAETAGFGLRAQVVRWEDLPDRTDADVLVVDTATRLVDDRTAADRITITMAALQDRFAAGQPVFYKRVDSLLRGPVAAEIAAWTASLDGPVVAAVAAPAFDITTQGGIQYVRDRALAVFDGGTDQCRITPATLVAGVHADLLQVRAPDFPERLTTALRAGRSLSTDGVTEGDLDLVASAVAAAHRQGLRAGLIGSFGLLGAWVAATRPRRRRGVLIAASSYRPATTAQLAAFAQDPDKTLLALGPDHDAVRARALAALDDGRDVAIATTMPGFTPDVVDERHAHDMAVMVTGILEAMRPVGLTLMGGELASHLFRMLAPRRLDVLAQPWPATPLVRFEGGDHDGLRAVIQSGSQGGANRLFQIAGLFHALDGAASSSASIPERTRHD